MTSSSSPSVHYSICSAELQVRYALEQLDESTEYLQDELEDLHERLRTLLGKMDRDAALTRDRAFLLSPDPPPEGLGDWIGGDGDDG